MTFGKRFQRNRKGVWAAAALGAVFVLGFIDSCDDRLLTVTSFIDPCGTILSNCDPGYFQTQAAGIGNPCWDPVCTIPGGCGNLDPPLGSQFDLCP
jgi:hypothetical protein